MEEQDVITRSELAQCGNRIDHGKKIQTFPGLSRSVPLQAPASQSANRPGEASPIGRCLARGPDRHSRPGWSDEATNARATIAPPQKGPTGPASSSLACSAAFRWEELPLVLRTSAALPCQSLQQLGRSTAHTYKFWAKRTIRASVPNARYFCVVE